MAPRADDAGSASACACGTVALGRCADCGTLVCRDHSFIWEDVLLCRDHLAVRRDVKVRQSRDAFADVLREHDRQSARCVFAFLEAATAIAPLSVPISKREVTVPAPPARGLFRRTTPPITKTVWEHAPAHRVYAWEEWQTWSDPPRRSHQLVYILLTGQVLFDGTRAGQDARLREFGNPRAGWVRGADAPTGALPFHVDGQHPVLASGQPTRIAQIAPTMDWFESVLARYLKQHAG